MTSMVLGDSTLESLTPSVNAPLTKSLPTYLEDPSFRLEGSVTLTKDRI
jgi:hypothetical protein